MVDSEKTVLTKLAKLVGADIEKHDRVQIMQMATLKIENLKATNVSIRAELDSVHNAASFVTGLTVEKESTPEVIPVKRKRTRK